MLNTKGLKFGKAVKAFSGKDPNRVPGNVQGLQIGHPMPTMSRQMNKLKLNRKKLFIVGHGLKKKKKFNF